MGLWRSWLACLYGIQKVRGSNPLRSTFNILAKPINMNNLKELEKTRKTFGYKELMQRIKFAFIPALKTEVLSPTPEQSSQVEKALKQNLEFPYATEILELIANFKFKLEHSKIDTRKDEDRKPTDIQFVNITGAWGRGPECESEVKALAVAMGEDGLLMDLVSMPGHGETSDMPQGWNTGELGSDFEFAAFTVADHINRNLKDNEKRPIIVNAWSMGGVSALKLAAQHPELVDGLILEDTPVFPQDIKKLSLRFMLYEIQKIRSVRSESSFDMNVDSPGLGIFSKRIKNRNKPEGIPLLKQFLDIQFRYILPLLSL